AVERARRALLNGSGSTWMVAWASQTGLAEQLAWRTAESLQAAGLPVRLLPVSELDAGCWRATSPCPGCATACWPWATA
ncbi:hypothetical protein ABTF60_19625, partial [Acinetobacter baumannii]